MKARFGGLVLAMLLTSMVAAPSGPALGAPSPEERQDDIAEEVERLREQVDEAAAAEAGILAELEVTRRARADLDATLTGVDRSIAAAEADLAASQGALDAAVARQDTSRRRLAAARARLEESRRALQAQAVSSFMRHGSKTETLDVLLDVRDVRALHDAMAFVDAVARSQAEVVARHHELEEGTALLALEAERAAAAASQRRDQVAGHKEELEAVRGEQADVLAGVRVEEEREEQLLAVAAETRDEYEARIATLEEESQGITDLLRRRQAAQAAQAAVAEERSGDLSPEQVVTQRGSGTLRYPLASAVVTSGFGYRTHPIFGTRRLHAGVDFRGSTGTPVLAAGDGTVVFAGTQGGYGNTVIVDHGGSLATLYAHQSRLAVSAGDTVAQGETVGAVGSTGFSTGPHLHFEVRVNGTPVDPLNYL